MYFNFLPIDLYIPNLHLALLLGGGGSNLHIEQPIEPMYGIFNISLHLP